MLVQSSPFKLTCVILMFVKLTDTNEQKKLQSIYVSSLPIENISFSNRLDFFSFTDT